jgi:hypothetical protein
VRSSSSARSVGPLILVTYHQFATPSLIKKKLRKAIPEPVSSSSRTNALLFLSPYLRCHAVYDSTLIVSMLHCSVWVHLLPFGRHLQVAINHFSKDTHHSCTRARAHRALEIEGQKHSVFPPPLVREATSMPHLFVKGSSVVIVGH